MSLKEDVGYIKNELSSEEKFIENFVKGERFFKKYKTLIIAVVVILIIGLIGFTIKKSIDNSNKHDANIALSQFLENGDEKALETLKNKNEKLYEVALFLQAKKDNKIASIELPLLKELVKFQTATASNNIEELNSLSMQNDFLLKEFALFNKALILVNEGKYEEAKKELSQISQTSKAYELATLLNHYLLTK
ncbi:tetratricopeptide repeat protein [Aliarcobacter butzleri]|jgi:predicted negative regulator of RcsB-dependent stress response|uniref:tetratricopeptide repeat protein n=1 Tax=Aliarcobacter butzleri TaxID=28197 RepID=UPI001EDB45AA|nr:tetratricopeptide repeat protein [Aliarcobacter butzleri]MCG3704207.1 tetratricopeptide repeat protein [Aliarcobacter butzleri]MCG3708276.1 tetratricopeptide repeat protein [Aliarcobacter butzleri]MDK2090773.1 tetratricopeptide repeat protein [Aliarcobacter butzleri]MDN5125768.1 tetratricopeptide repeat protein [Aliarcobacter butzleri]MDS1370498.1 tetratricopeptide repeat protein [Aliarcobacter butzleri]